MRPPLLRLILESRWEGSDVAVHASDLTLMRNDLTSVVDAIELSRRTLRTIKVNLLWAFGYNDRCRPTCHVRTTFPTCRWSGDGLI